KLRRSADGHARGLPHLVLRRADLRLVRAQSRVQRLQADAEDLGCLSLAPLDMFQSGEGEPPFVLGERRADFQEEPLTTLRGRWREDLGWKTIGRDLLFRHDEGALDGVLQLADVALPRMDVQKLARLLREPLLPLVLSLELRDEIVREQIDVLLALA